MCPSGESAVASFSDRRQSMTESRELFTLGRPLVCPDQAF